MEFSGRLSFALDLDGLGRNSECDVIRLHVSGNNGAGPDHGMFPNPNSRENSGVVGDSSGVADPGGAVGYLLDIIDVVAVGIDVCVVGDRNIIPYLDTTAVIQQHVTMDDDVVAEG